MDDQDATADDEFIDDFDDEAALRELDALTWRVFESFRMTAP